MMTCLRAELTRGQRTITLEIKGSGGEAPRCVSEPDSSLRFGSLCSAAEAAPRVENTRPESLLTLWIDHLRKTRPVLVDLLGHRSIAACIRASLLGFRVGNLKNRSLFLKMAALDDRYAMFDDPRRAASR